MREREKGGIPSRTALVVLRQVSKTIFVKKIESPSKWAYKIYATKQKSLSQLWQRWVESQILQ